MIESSNNEDWMLEIAAQSEPVEPGPKIDIDVSPTTRELVTGPKTSKDDRRN